MGSSAQTFIVLKSEKYFGFGPIPLVFWDDYEPFIKYDHY
jgi:hypothetical protein